MSLMDLLARWYRTWRANAGTQGRAAPSQGELWRAMGGDPQRQVDQGPPPRLSTPR